MSVPRSLHVRRVLVDSAAYYALTDQESLQHAHAVAETHSLLLNRLCCDLAALVLQQIDRGMTTIVRVSAHDERRALEIITLHDDKDYSLTDAMSFAVMERLRIGAAFGFDHHFAQYGFDVLGAEGA